MNNKYEDSSNKEKKENLEALKEKLFNDLIEASLCEDIINEKQKQLGLKLEYPSEMFAISVAEKYNSTGLAREWDGQLLLFSIKRIVEDLLRPSMQNIVFRDNKLNVLVISPLASKVNVDKFCSELLKVVEVSLGQRVIIVHKTIFKGCEEIHNIYRELLKETEKEKNRSPVVTLCKKYIDENYYKVDLSLQDIANIFQINPAYLSRLIKQDLGLTFIDYLSMVRINKAVKMMKDPMIKIYEISNTVGYSSQHYFSTAFKKVMGVSPGEYRKGGTNNWQQNL
jgi:two-component system, response regulator YesN